MTYKSTALSGVSGTAAALDWMQMLSGAALAVFMILHTFFVGSVILGAHVFNGLAVFFESTNLAQLGGPFIALLFLFHFILTARKIPFTSKEQRVAFKQSYMLSHFDTWTWVAQVISGMAILLMGSIHVWVLLNDLPITAEKSAHHLHQGLWFWFYFLFLFFVFLHLGAGIYRIGVKWGAIRRSNRANVKKIIYAGVGLFVCLDIVSLLVFYFQ